MDGIDFQPSEGEEVADADAIFVAPAPAGDIRSNYDWQETEQESATSFSSDLDLSSSKPPSFCTELPGKIEPSSMGDAMILACGLLYFPNMLHADMKGEGSLSFNLHPLDQRLLETELRASLNATPDTLFSTYREEVGRDSEPAQDRLTHMVASSNSADQQSGADDSQLPTPFSCSVPGCTIDHTAVLQTSDSFLYSSQPQSIGPGELFRGCSCTQCSQLLTGPLPTPLAITEPCLLPCCNPLSASSLAATGGLIS